MEMGRITPILRMFDEAKAKEFYIGFLGFSVGFEHRFEPGMPLYMGISRDDCFIHLSEHHGDGSPGSHIRIECGDVDALQRELIAKQYKYGRPGVEDTPWNTRELNAHDPFGNRLTFFTNKPAQA
jgi:catechol 2,3-dioxygenase-like lactoylglutathione lyase family enzyme